MEKEPIINNIESGESIENNVELDKIDRKLAETIDKSEIKETDKERDSAIRKEKYKIEDSFAQHSNDKEVIEETPIQEAERLKGEVNSYPENIKELGDRIWDRELPKLSNVVKDLGIIAKSALSGEFFRRDKKESTDFIREKIDGGFREDGISDENIKSAREYVAKRHSLLYAEEESQRPEDWKKPTTLWEFAKDDWSKSKKKK